MKGVALLYKIESPHLRMFYAKFGWNWLNFFWEEDENVGSLQTEGRTDNRSENLTAFSSGELKTIDRGSMKSRALRGQWSYLKWLNYYNLFLPHQSPRLKWALSVIIINFSHFHLLLKHWANFNQTWHKASLVERNSNLLKWRAPPFSKGRY